MDLNWLSEQPGLSPHYYYCASCSATYNSCSAFVSMHETRGQAARIRSAHGRWSIIILIQGSRPACTHSEWRSSPGHILIISKCRTCWVHERLFERIMWIKCFLHKESVQKKQLRREELLSRWLLLSQNYKVFPFNTNSCWFPRGITYLEAQTPVCKHHFCMRIFWCIGAP